MNRLLGLLKPLSGISILASSRNSSAFFAYRAPVCAFSTRPHSISDNETSETVDASFDEIEVLDDVIEPKMDEFGRSYGTGRRKTGIARVWLKEGSGQITVNNKAIHQYFQPTQRREAIMALEEAKVSGQYDVWCTVKGGGITGQAGAVRLGIARALKAQVPILQPTLSKSGMLTRDPRRVERKKPGQKKARKKFQWVKR